LTFAGDAPFDLQEILGGDVLGEATETFRHYPTALLPLDYREALTTILERYRTDKTARPMATMVNAVAGALIQSIQKLHPVHLDVRQVEGFRAEQELVTRFLLENSPMLADVPMCRMLPIFLYAERPIDRRLIEAWVADLGFRYLDVLPPLQGSWLERLFVTDGQPLTLEQFWDKHRRAHIITNIAGQLSLLSVSVALAGIIASRYPPPPPVVTTATTHQTDQPSDIKPPSPPQAAQTTIINIYGLTNNIGPLVQAQTPEDARKIIEKMVEQPHAQAPGTKSGKAAKAGKGSKKGKHGKGRKDGNAGKKARGHKGDRGTLEA
jgi:hypothetical protein